MHEKMAAWSPPGHWLRITTLDAHTGGEPFRVITGGFPDVEGDTILEKRRYLRERLDHLRTALMWEPRGHADMYGCLVTPPVTPGADFGVIFLHNEGYSSMCGHGIIAITKVVLETGAIPMTAPETNLKIDAPAGLITAKAQVAEGKVLSVRFQNVPSFVYAASLKVDVPGMGQVPCDIVYGGAFYAYVQAADAGVTLTPDHFSELVDKGMAIKRAVMDQHPVVHPFEEDLSFLYGTIFIGPPESPDHHSRNVCVFAEGEVDRSPTGTGVCGRLALHFARGEIALDEAITIESIIGSHFTGRVKHVTQFGPHHGIIPEVEGTAHITGKHSFFIDPEDPLRDGFILR